MKGSTFFFFLYLLITARVVTCWHQPVIKEIDKETTLKRDCWLVPQPAEEIVCGEGKNLNHRYLSLKGFTLKTQI